MVKLRSYFTHQRHPKPRPYGRAMECLSWVLQRKITMTLQWRHNDHDSVSNHQHHDCLLNRLFRRKPKKTSKLRVTGLCAGNSPGTGESPAQMASYAEKVSIWWRHHDISRAPCMVDTRSDHSMIVSRTNLAFASLVSIDIYLVTKS